MAAIFYDLDLIFYHLSRIVYQMIFYHWGKIQSLKYLWEYCDLPLKNWFLFLVWCALKVNVVEKKVEPSRAIHEPLFGYNKLYYYWGS